MARSSATQASISIGVDTRGIKRLAHDLMKAAPEEYITIRRGLKAFAQMVADEATTNAPSEAIANTIQVKGSLFNMRVTAGDADHPEAALLEVGNRGGHSGPGTFRHPVFGNMDNWVEQPKKPYLGPAFDAHREEGIELLTESAMAALRTAGVIDRV